MRAASYACEERRHTGEPSVWRRHDVLCVRGSASLRRLHRGRIRSRSMCAWRGGYGIALIFWFERSPCVCVDKRPDEQDDSVAFIIALCVREGAARWLSLASKARGRSMRVWRGGRADAEKAFNRWSLYACVERRKVDEDIAVRHGVLYACVERRVLVPKALWLQRVALCVPGRALQWISNAGKVVDRSMRIWAGERLGLI